jgi:hypothetical protein
MAASNVKLFPNRIAALTSQTGIVGRFMTSFAQDVVARAAIEAPTDTGRLSRSIRQERQFFGPTTVDIRIGSKAVNPRNDFMYARAVHTGARARQARPGGLMKFKPRRSNRWVVTARVGPIPADPYLTDALRAANATLPSGTRFRIVTNNKR